MIVGLVGKKRSGKDTIAKHLITNYGFAHYALADPIKRAVMEMFDMNENQLWGDKKEVVDPRWGITPRQLLQQLGTEWAQHMLPKAFPEYDKMVGRNLWLKRFVIWHLKYSNPYIVISDVRFPHEIEFFKSYVAYFIYVERPGLEDEVDNHESEKFYSELDCDVVVWNNGTVEELHEKIDIIMKSVHGLGA